jgi:predicted Zn-dependent protease with MMP-like domain
MEATGDVPRDMRGHGASLSGMAHLGGVVSGPRPGRMRDRRGRGARGPMALPGPLSPGSVPSHRTAREQFDVLVEGVLTALAKHFAAETDPVDVVVEEAPLLPPEWSDDVPTSTGVTVDGTSRIVLYRLPISQRCSDSIQLEDALWQVLLDRLAEVWQVSPDDIDPR